jgi:hypothetical protein
MSLPELIWSVIGFLLTVMIFSYILGDNPAFRLAAYLFVGVTAGYVTVVVFDQVLYPQLVHPLMNGQILTIIPLILSILLLLKVFPPLARFGNIPMAYLVGAGAAVMIGGAILGTIFPQISGTAILFNLNTAVAKQIDPAYALFNGILILVGTVTTLMYFYFGAKTNSDQVPRRNQFIETLASVGQLFIGITLGALFAGVYSSALSALIERVSSTWYLIQHILGL